MKHRSSVNQSMFAREIWAAHMQAAGYTDREKTPMTMHTRTQESEFGESVTAARPDVAAADAAVGMRRRAQDEGYEHLVIPTYRVITVMNEVTAPDTGYYTATASATFAKIVPLEDANEPNEGDMDGEREVRGPEEKDYSDLTEAPVPDPWDPL